MSAFDIKIWGPFVALHCFWMVCGLSWIAGEFVGPRPPKSMAELKSRANQSRRWYLNPFHDRTMTIWKYAAWITGFAWLAAHFFNLEK
jgi:hypothetical protein